MTTLLHIDSSARAGLSGRDARGSHSRRLTARFVDRWRAARPADPVIYRDVGAAPPSPVTGDWIHAAFTPPERREAWMATALAESDRLVDEVLAADVIVLGAPMYNFGPPAQLKAWLDNIVRVGRTFGFDRARAGEPYWPMLDTAGKTLVILSSRGDHGYAPGGRLAHANHLEPALRTPFGYLGVTDVHEAAIEYDEFADARLAASVAAAEARVDDLVETLLAARSEAAAA
ncbi:FMN-dependent NADH-azoreductase [Caulobacter rhizosphaerae]|uniref:FMN dependent NADH:quinone oxidoreductase n=1 Tax=Caulobacter rhizosphaerae TaxID=2010972 RepID=A0ABU1N1Y6_9CAUL|nr:NAD(P)H-dependent oxidoreductase [Caulobacter rhizosphaerae]MDR6531961.1 FMN-dependent NADH-azoreductase [Caulobacter rhizosphaerae]